MFRFDNPDALLVLLLTAAAYTTVRAVETASGRGFGNPDGTANGTPNRNNGVPGATAPGVAPGGAAPGTGDPASGSGDPASAAGGTGSAAGGTGSAAGGAVPGAAAADGAGGPGGGPGGGIGGGMGGGIGGQGGANSELTALPKAGTTKWSAAVSATVYDLTPTR